MKSHVRKFLSWLRTSSPQRRLVLRLMGLGTAMAAALILIVWAQRSLTRASREAPEASSLVEPQQPTASTSRNSSSETPGNLPLSAVVRAPHPIPDQSRSDLSSNDASKASGFSDSSARSPEAYATESTGQGGLVGVPDHADASQPPVPERAPSRFTLSPPASVPPSAPVVPDGVPPAPLAVSRLGDANTGIDGAPNPTPNDETPGGASRPSEPDQIATTSEGTGAEAAAVSATRWSTLTATSTAPQPPSIAGLAPQPTEPSFASTGDSARSPQTTVHSSDTSSPEDHAVSRVQQPVIASVETQSNTNSSSRFLVNSARSDSTSRVEAERAIRDGHLQPARYSLDGDTESPPATTDSASAAEAVGEPPQDASIAEPSTVGSMLRNPNLPGFTERHDQTSSQGNEERPQPSATGYATTGERSTSSSDSQVRSARIDDLSQQPAIANTADAGGPSTDIARLVSARPGAATLDGPRSPALLIEKTAPQQVQVGRPATFHILVNNVGSVTAEEVTVTDAVPQGTRLVSTEPQAVIQNDLMIWSLGRLTAGQTVRLTYVLVPEQEGELGSVAHVRFSALAGARTIATQPVLKLSVAAPHSVLIGQTVPLRIQLVNEGSGPAYNLLIEEDVPDGFSHPAGRALQNMVGTLQPGESRVLQLPLVAQQAGRAVNRVRVRDDQNELARAETPIDVLAPQLALRWSGPSLRFLDRDAEHELTLANVGTASAHNVQLVAALPKGLRFVAADKLGRYVPEQHAVYWNLLELPPGQEGVVRLTTRAVAEGQQILRAEVSAELGAAAQADHMLRVESAADLQFAVTDLSDPVEVNGEALYQVELANVGTSPDTNLLVTISSSGELELLSVDGAQINSVSPQRIELQPIARLPAGQRLVWRVRARARSAGQALLRVQVQSDQMPQPITKEEGTRIYTG